MACAWRRLSTCPMARKPGEKFPALLEYLPYRKDDGTAAGDYPKHAYFARRGYVSVRVDIRGFGASEGVPPEREYSEQEQVDGEQVIAWLAHQPWSNGNVGMFGISWGGFTALQMAMRHRAGIEGDSCDCTPPANYFTMMFTTSTAWRTWMSSN